MKHYLIKNPSPEQLAAAKQSVPRTQHGYTFLSSQNETLFEDQVAYPKELVRNFFNSGIDSLPLFELALKYGTFHIIDDNRKKSGEWYAAVAKATVILKRDEGAISDQDRIALDNQMLGLISLLASGDWKTCKEQLLDGDPSFFSQLPPNFQTLVQPLVDVIVGYLTVYYD